MGVGQSWLAGGLLRGSAHWPRLLHASMRRPGPSPATLLQRYRSFRAPVEKRYVYKLDAQVCCLNKWEPAAQITQNRNLHFAAMITIHDPPLQTVLHF